jgi:hypothetical protein
VSRTVPMKLIAFPLPLLPGELYSINGSLAHRWLGVAVARDVRMFRSGSEGSLPLFDRLWRVEAHLIPSRQGRITRDTGAGALDNRAGSVLALLV